MHMQLYLRFEYELIKTNGTIVWQVHTSGLIQCTSLSEVDSNVYRLWLVYCWDEKEWIIVIMYIW